MGSSHSKPWTEPLSEEKFDFLKEILAAPSPIGLEAAMSYGVIKPFFDEIKLDSWKVHQFKGNAGIVLDTHPDQPELPTVMVIGHADKIRMQVRQVGADGKIWIDSDSFIPNVLIGHEVNIFPQNPEKPGEYNVISGGTIEALGAIHFADAETRSGGKGIKKEMLYVELQMHGEKPKQKLEKLGIKAGDPIIFNRPIKKGFSENTFYGAYLDNGLGCFTVTELAELVAKKPFKNIRLLLTIATHEEIGRFGATAMAGELKPDVIFGTDVNHDYDAAPGISSKRMAKLSMGKGYTLSNGSITSAFLNQLFEEASLEADIPYQRDVTGRDTGTDAMAAALAGFDCAATSIGFPIRNMHTISETGHTGDILAAIYGMEATLRKMDSMNDGKGISLDDFRNNHTRLDLSKSTTINA